MNRPVVQHKAVVSIYGSGFWVFWVNDQHAHQAHCELGHFIRMRVVHVRAVLLHHEFIDIGLAGLNLWLAKTANTVHTTG